MGIGFSFIYKELLDAASFGSSLSSSLSSLGDSTSVFSLQQIWGQAVTQKTADLLPWFTQVHAGCRQTPTDCLSLCASLLIFLFISVPDLIHLWLCLRPHLFPGLLCWWVQQCGNLLLLLSWSGLLSSCMYGTDWFHWIWWCRAIDTQQPLWHVLTRCCVFWNKFLLLLSLLSQICLLGPKSSIWMWAVIHACFVVGPNQNDVSDSCLENAHV